MITRRGFLGALPAVPLTAAVVSGSGGVHKYGAVDVQTHLSHRRRTGEFLRVYIDGEDVTAVCQFADDRAGVVELIVKSEGDFERWHAKGGYYVGSVTVRVSGDVALKPGEPL
jgi:hypothetical protein